MKHTTLTDHDRERAALYALGALEPDEAADFATHLASGCTRCAAEVSAFHSVAGDLALATRASPPPPRVRQQVLDRIVYHAPAGFRFLRAGEGAWSPIAPGVSRRDLGPTTFLIRLDPGAQVPRHPHASVEHCYVLEGDLHVADHHLQAGDYHEAEAGSVHDGLTSDRGCVLLIVEAGATGA